MRDELRETLGERIKMAQQTLRCPSCGSPDLEKITWNERRCRHCGMVSVLSHDQQFLLIEWQCPHCGFNNEKGWERCGKCGTPLIKKCLSCQATMRWDLTHCPRCGRPYQPIPAIITCSRCGSANDASEIYCQQCADPFPGEVECPHCRRSIPAKAQYCPHCASKL